eukprot:TRINITY_DN1483_c0_g1_i1.p1 TRINITY_DN1483_c0_g1~~TRINITY_DN1483_c0_g1_i1.p1  ORF type:complete len:101 (-),score=25.08 TRINITY_DN1483_c0_g1_i1:158-460(-)
MVQKKSQSVRREELVKKFTLKKPVSAEEGPIDSYSTYLQMIGMIAGVLGLLLRNRYAALLSFACAIISICNMKSSELDLKNIFSSLSVSLMGLLFAYRTQ